jgi:RsiW-degrading membrane proteinase PrsW (M82 family)
MPDSALPNRILLECIAGRDEHARIMVDERPIRIGHASLQPALAIAEIPAAEGFLLIQVRESILRIDATNCLLPIYIDNSEITTAPLRETDVLRIGNSIWRARYSTGRGTTDALREGFTNLIGLEALKDFRLADVFSEVFKKHTSEEMEEQLIPGLIFVGSFAVPMSTLVFFLEMNVPRNISIFRIIQLLFVGGVASIIVALIFFNRLDFFSSFLGASAAGIIEESAKLLIVALLLGRTTRYHWILNGLLLGAAIGTGFAAFESSGYAFEAMLRADNVYVGVANIVLRGIDAPFTHIVWTANSTAALWLVKGNRPFAWDMLKAPAFLRVFISSVLIHMCWDAPFGLIPLPLVIDLKFVILGLLGWVICLRLVQAGLQQLNKARQELSLPAITD